MHHVRNFHTVASGNDIFPPHGVKGDTRWRAHSTPDPDVEPPAPNPNPDNLPPPAHAPVQEPPRVTEPPIKARRS